MRGIDRDIMPMEQTYGMGLLPYFPPSTGQMHGKYNHSPPIPGNSWLTTMQRLAERYLTDANWAIAEKLKHFAEKRGHTILELAFSWLLCRPPVASVIAGATKPEQLEQNVKAGGWKLSAEEMAEIDGITGVA